MVVVVAMVKVEAVVVVAAAADLMTFVDVEVLT